MRTRLAVPLLALLVTLLITAVFAGKGPLQDTHWDAAIYLGSGKEMAATDYLRDYSRYAAKIAARLPEFKAGTDAYTPYWGFMRLGHTLLLGAVTAVMGADMAALQTAFWLYSFMLAAALVLAGRLCGRIVRLLVPSLPEPAVTRGAIIAMALYLASDVYRYLSGTFVAEVPAMLLLAVSSYFLVMANERRRASIAFLAGASAFALYVAKMEAIWSFVSFSLLYATVLFFNRKGNLWWPAFWISALCALALFGLYSWWFWPLTDPRLLLVFAEAFRNGANNAVAPGKLWVAAGGLLWLGLWPAFRHGGRSPVLWLALAWLAMVSLPYADAILNDRPAQVRMFALIMPPLLLAATVGFATLLARQAENQAGRLTLPLLLGAALALMALSHAETYPRLRDLPGGWRLQYLKVFLSPPPYERMDYPLKDLVAISRYVHAGESPTLLIRDDKVPEEDSNIISYFGPPPVRSTIEKFAAPAGTSVGLCGSRNIELASGRVMYCNAPPAQDTLAKLVTAGVRIVYLRQRNGTTAHLPKERPAFATRSLMLLSEHGNQ